MQYFNLNLRRGFLSKMSTFLTDTKQKLRNFRLFLGINQKLKGYFAACNDLFSHLFLYPGAKGTCGILMPHVIASWLLRGTDLLQLAVADAGFPRGGRQPLSLGRKPIT